jgi:hypothetical protein
MPPLPATSTVWRPIAARVSTARHADGASSMPPLRRVGRSCVRPTPTPLRRSLTVVNDDAASAVAPPWAAAVLPSFATAARFAAAGAGDRPPTAAAA